MSTTVIHTIEHDIGIDGVLEIRLGDGDVRLRGIDGTTVRVSGDPGDDLDGRLAIDRGAGSLSIRPDRRGDSGEAWHAGRTPDLAIDAPRGATLVVDSSSGDITAESFTGEQRYRSASGDIRLRGVTGRLTVEAVSGDVDATITGEAAISARTVSGDLALRAATIATLRATTTSGDIRLAGRARRPGAVHDRIRQRRCAAGPGRRRPRGPPDRRRRPPLRDPGPLREPSGEALDDHRQRRLDPVGPHDVRRCPDRPRESGDARRARGRAGPRGSADHRGHARPGADGEVPDLTDAAADARLAILRALERGEIDVAEATRRLEAHRVRRRARDGPGRDDRDRDRRRPDRRARPTTARPTTARPTTAATNAAPATTEEATDA